MPLDRLSEQFRTRRLDQTVQERATISIQYVEPPARHDRFTGRVLIDGRRIGDLVGNVPRIFDVEPGEHTVTVFFQKRSYSSYQGWSECSTSVFVGPGDRADVCCGLRREVEVAWARAERSHAIRVLTPIGLVELAATAGWFSSPLLRRAAAFAVLNLPIGDSWVPVCYKLANRPFSAFWFAVATFWWLRRLNCFRRSETREERLSRLGSPYYIERTS